MRVVLDTNVIVSGLLWPGAPSGVLQAVRDGRIIAFTSRELLIELADVLSRPHLAGMIASQQTTAEALVRGYAVLATSVVVEAVAAVVQGDPDDDVASRRQSRRALMPSSRATDASWRLSSIAASKSLG